MWRSGSKPRSGTSSGKSSNAARGASPISSASATSARRAHEIDELAQRNRLVVVHVGGDLGSAPILQIETECAHASRPASRLTQLGGDRSRDLDVGGLQVDVEGHERRARGGQHRARRRMGSAGPIVGDELARLHAQRELPRTAAPDPGPFGVLRPGGQLAVEEHRQFEVLADQRRCGEQLGAGRPAALLVEIDHRHHVERTDVRVDARVGADVDQLHRGSRAADQASSQLALARGEGEHRAVVVGIGVEVEEARRSEGPLDRLEGAEIASLTHVGDGHQQGPVGHAGEG